VKIIKNILKKKQKLALSLLAYQTSSLETGFNPAELLMGRKLRTFIPCSSKTLNPMAILKRTLASAVEEEENKGQNKPRPTP